MNTIDSNAHIKLDQLRAALAEAEHAFSATVTRWLKVGNANSSVLARINREPTLAIVHEVGDSVTKMAILRRAIELQSAAIASA